ncbi:hypothetical protein KSP39_PZI004230 [Platanthera zijinensis]|uniref:Subtilisin-like protease fibronectin type-III domain-containing protein n=1 Tax=Platanthera zijinensis TaxID=2320716 RepID=A0AAP0BVV6_9ASPA
MAAEQLNYPSVSVAMGSNSEKTVMRTVSNVGEEEAVYSVQIRAPEGAEVTVYPGKLGFSAIKQNRSLTSTSAPTTWENGEELWHSRTGPAHMGFPFR